MFIKTQVKLYDMVDSVHNIDYKINNNDFTLSYQYELEQVTKDGANIISFNLEEFVKNDYYTPFHLRNKRNKNGYIHNEYDKKYSITFDLNGKFQWMENKLLSKQLSNSIGEVKSGYLKNENKLNTNFEIIYNKEFFTPDLWNEVLEMRDISYNFLTANLYFKRK